MEETIEIIVEKALKETGHMDGNDAYRVLSEVSIRLQQEACKALEREYYKPYNGEDNE